MASDTRERPIAAFNTSLDEFFHQVEAGRWDLRDARSKSTAILQQDK